MVLDNFVFLDETSTSGTSNVLNVVPNAQELILHVSGANPGITVKGRVDMEGDWMNISTVQSGSSTTEKSFKVFSTITEPGIYSVPLIAVRQVFLQSTATAGSIKAYGVVTKE